ncbi:CLUMA_CG007654, isoform A [Clunio marinus]|uniref:6-pyruvoyltetrahydropterin synthase n=1 Tax=Clunio marinus TaxID=568069 RepID=A0A1J1I5E0_9DIPT|nr:CLUMA_CG007654, isoform A [Clunio marinus]
MTTTPIVTITRKESFSSAHRLHSKSLSDEENRNIFGKCNSLNGHGHNYTAEVSVRGPIDRENGMVMNLTELKQLMNDCIMTTMDHKNIDMDVPYFKTIPSTAENIAVFIWDSLSARLPKPELLFEVKLWETDKNYVTYRGKKTEVRSDRRSGKNICGSMSSDSE